MLTLRRIEVRNFVCFNDLTIEPSFDPHRPLTVIRAENANGKTTLLRAIRWGMYGEKGLPGSSYRYSLHPASWNPLAPDVKTRVSLEFETDGSSRNYAATGSPPLLYRLDRTVRTIGKPNASENAPDFHRVDERVTLMVRDAGGKWGSHERHPDAVIMELLPWDLRDFFIMDADEAADFVGGSDENRTISRQEYQQKTSHAINSLLGLDVFKSAKTRVGRIAREFSKKATKAVGDHDLSELQEELDRARVDKDELDDAIQEQKDRQAELADTLDVLQSELETEIGRLGAYDALRDQLQRNRAELQRERHDRDSRLVTLAGNLESRDLLVSLSSEAILKTRRFLKPLYEQGRIPLAHLPFVRSLLEAGRCVCGQNLLDGVFRSTVSELVVETERDAVRADYLYHLYQAALTLDDVAVRSTWNDTRSAHAADLAVCDQRLSELKTERKEIDRKLDQIDEAKIDLVRDEIAAVRTQCDNTTSQLDRYVYLVQQLNEQIGPLEKKISQRQRNVRAAADHRAAEDMACFVVDVLDQAYSVIQDQQVKDLSEKMNLLFHQMAANVSDEDFAANQRIRSNLRMIVEVGVRTVEDRPDRFEIYALNGRGRAMPPVEINGASRRVLALSFVLALCDESDTRAPLIADSLLNVMSGTVRRNTLRVTSSHSRQPILLLNNSDLEATSEVETVTQHAGATYTLTAQWDSIAAGEGGDVLNRVEDGQVAILCCCGPREYCEVCERIGQASSPGWTRRQG
ncbi:MAG: AAA family ATPase [bacterium]|nr:AAA family ATPase [bacterium]